MAKGAMSEWLRLKVEGVLETAEWAQKYDEAVLKGDWKGAHDLVADTLQRVTKDVNRQTEALAQLSEHFIRLRKRHRNSLKRLKILEQKRQTAVEKEAAERGL